MRMRARLKTFLHHTLTFFSVIVLLEAVWGAARAQDTVHSPAGLMDGVLQYARVQTGARDNNAYIADVLSKNVGGTAEWYVLALRQMDPSLCFAPYADALEAYVEKTEVHSAATRMKLALTLVACGREDHPCVQQCAAEAAMAQESVMSRIFGLHLLRSLSVPDDALAGARKALLALRLPDGGWTVQGGSSDADVTAMALQALAPDAALPDVAPVVEGALTLLSRRQSEDGDFASYGAYSPESTAQVAMALTALGLDPQTDERFIKNGHTVLDGMTRYLLPDGSFRHSLKETSGNPLATVQVFCALVSMVRFDRGAGSFYLFDTPLQTARPAPSWQTWFCLAIILAGAAVCAVLWLRKKKDGRNFLFVALLCAVLMGLTQLVTIESPAAYYGSTEPSGAPAGQVTLSISCRTVAGRTGDAPISADGAVLPETGLPLYAGDTVLDVLVRAARQTGLQLDYTGASGRMAYVRGIATLYEFDFGDLSGWVYHVNGLSPNVGCGEYYPADGDHIEWLYTVALGNDV